MLVPFSETNLAAIFEVGFKRRKCLFRDVELTKKIKCKSSDAAELWNSVSEACLLVDSSFCVGFALIT